VDSAAASEQPQAPGSATKSSQNKAANGGGSGASTMGENTPSGRKKGLADALMQRSGLKRPGSPDLSEASGNESTTLRKKKKLDNGSGVSASNLSAKLLNRRAGEESGASGTESSRKKTSDASRLNKKLPLGQGAAARMLGASGRAGSAGSGSESESVKRSRLLRTTGTIAGPSRSGGASPAHESRSGSPPTGSQGQAGKSGSRSGSPAAVAPGKFVSIHLPSAVIPCCR
jgi:transcription initiation factor TFIIF subunit alpha